MDSKKYEFGDLSENRNKIADYRKDFYFSLSSKIYIFTRLCYIIFIICSIIKIQWALDNSMNLMLNYTTKNAFSAYKTLMELNTTNVSVEPCMKIVFSYKSQHN